MNTYQSLQGIVMENSDILTVVITLIGALTSAKAWEYYQKKQVVKQEESQQKLAETHLYRDDLRNEVARLRVKLEESYKKKQVEIQALQDQIAELREQLATFRTRVEFLEKENELLRGNQTDQ